MVISLLSMCSDIALVQIIHIIKKALTLIQIIGPILTMVSLYISFVQGTINPKNSESGSKSVNKKIFNTLIATVILFFLPIVVNLVMTVLSNTGISNIIDLPTCWVEAEKVYKSQSNYKANSSNINSNSYASNTKKSKKKKSNTTVSKKSIKKIKLKSKSIKRNNKTRKAIKNGRKYKLTSNQIKYLAAVCMREQGSISGMKGEAQLIANRYELYGSKYSSVYDYVRNSGWFGSHSVSPTNNKSAINVVNSVFTQGNRTIPLYVDEHDCWFCNSKKYCGNGNSGDICSISGGSSKSYITNRKNYKQDKTKIHNVYGGTYTFYYFPASNSDPFGYTDMAYKKVKSMNK